MANKNKPTTETKVESTLPLVPNGPRVSSHGHQTLELEIKVLDVYDPTTCQICNAVRDVRHPPFAERQALAFCVFERPGRETPTFCRASGTRLLRLRNDQTPWSCAERASRE